jgi:hypothetical protein
MHCIHIRIMYPGASSDNDNEIVNSLMSYWNSCPLIAGLSFAGLKEVSALLVIHSKVRMTCVV